MAYKKPGAYARFITTASAVNNAGSTRVMAIVGTGKMFFDKLSESVLRDSTGTTDTLANENVYEIYHVTSKPLKNGEVDLSNGGIEYVANTHYELKDGKYVAWKIKTAPSLTKTAGGSTGSSVFAGAVSASVKNDYLVTTGKYKVEITYVDSTTPSLGTYSVSDQSTGEVLGEYQVGATAVNPIPGIDLFVTQTFFAKTEDADNNPATPETNVLDSLGDVVSKTSTGDYVILDITGGVPVDGAPTNGTSYYVSYAYKKAEDDYQPKVFSDYQDLVAEYGDYEVTASGKVINSLSLAAEIAFTVGANPIVCVQAKNDSDYAMQKAIDMLEKAVPGVTTISTVVPLSTSKIVASYAMNHIDKMSDYSVGKERMTYIGAPISESYMASAAAAASFNNERVVYVVPGAATKTIRDVTTGKSYTRKIPGCYLAVAVAALGVKNDPAEPLTNKTIGGFDSLGTLYTESEKNAMAEKGCLVLELSGSNIKIRHGMTTSVADVNSNEITLVQIKDYVIDSARNTLGALYVGKKLLPSVVNDVKSTLISLLNQFVGQEVIIGYGNVSVKRSSDDPRAINVKFEIEAVYPLNYINIEFSFSGVN